MTYPEGAPAATKQDKRKHHAEFRADLLGSESVHVLQIHASTYEEFDEQDESIGTRCHRDIADASSRVPALRRVGSTAIPDGTHHSQLV